MCRVLIICTDMAYQKGKRIFSYWFEQILYSHKEGAVFRSFLIFPVPADTKAPHY